MSRTVFYVEMGILREWMQRVFPESAQILYVCLLLVNRWWMINCTNVPLTYTSIIRHQFGLWLGGRGCFIFARTSERRVGERCAICHSAASGCARVCFYDFPHTQVQQSSGWRTMGKLRKCSVSWNRLGCWDLAGRFHHVRLRTAVFRLRQM